MPQRGYELAPGGRRSGLRGSTRRTRRNTRSSVSWRSSGSWAIGSFKKTRALKKALPGYVDKSPFPPSKGYKLNYEDDGFLTVGASGILGTEWKFTLNDLFDPDASGTGHQPYGYDALQVAYTRYKVSGCLVDILFYDCQTAGAIDCSYMISNPAEYSSATLTGATSEAIGERQMAETIVLQNTGAQKRRVKFYLPMHTAFGLTKLQYKADVDNTTSAVGGSPGSKVGLHIATSDPNDGSSGGSRFKIKLTYFCTLYQRQIMSQS